MSAAFILSFLYKIKDNKTNLIQCEFKKLKLMFINYYNDQTTINGLIIINKKKKLTIKNFTLTHLYKKIGST